MKKRIGQLYVVFHPENSSGLDESGSHDDYSCGSNDFPHEMHHVGGGVFCDDDGDNWDFL